MMGSSKLINCTVVGNTYEAEDTGRVLGVSLYSANAQVKNCVILANGNTSGDIRNIDSSAAYEYCAVAEAETTGCTAAASATLADDFVLTDGLYYPLRSGSACDAGNQSLLPAAYTTDLLGAARICGSEIDIGAIEANVDILSISFAADTESRAIPFSTTLTATATGGTPPYVYSWDLDGDGVYERSGAALSQVTLEINVASTSNVTLKVEDSGSQQATFSQEFAVYQETFYVDAASENPVPPYLTPETAATTVEAAAAIATGGATISVATGTYTLTGTLTIPSDVALKGATGDRDDVTISGGLKYAVILSEGAGAEDVTFSALKCSSDYGVWMKADTTMDNCHVTGCSSVSIYFHGGVYNQGGTVNNTLIDLNGTDQTRARATGYHQTGAQAKISNSIIRGNEMRKGATATRPSSLDGVGPAAPVFLEAGDMVNCIVTGNRRNTNTDASPYTHPLATAIYASGASKIVNCLVADNTYAGDVSDRFSGVCLLNANAKVENCVLRGNGHSSGTAECNLQSTRYSQCANCATDAAAAANITDGLAATIADEYDIAGGTYFLRGDSQLVDAGKAQAASLVGEADVNGKTRVSGAAIDIGPSEYQVKALDCIIQASATTGFDSLTAHLTAVVKGSALTGLSYDWDIGDGQPHTGASVDVTLTEPGSRTVTLVVTNDQSDEATASVVLTVHQKTHYVSSVEDLQPTVDQAVSGAEVVLAAGDYQLSSTLYVTNGVTVRGATGKYGDVRLLGTYPDNYRRFTVVCVKDAGSTLASLTVENGYGVWQNSTSPGGVVMYENTVVSNCCVQKNASTDYWIYGVGIRNLGGRVSDSVIAGNFNTWERAHAVGYYQSAGLIERTQIVSNYCASIGLVKETGVYATAMGAYLIGGTMQNCLVADNYIGSIGIKNPSVTIGIGATFAGSSRAVNSLFRHNTYAGDTTVNIVGVKRLDTASVVNCAMFDNGKADGSVISNLVGDASFDHCAADDVTGCTDSIATTFAAAYRTDRRTGLWRLRRDSPLVDAGASQPSLEDGTDLVGNPRLFGTAIDIGPVELQGRKGLMLLVK